MTGVTTNTATPEVFKSKMIIALTKAEQSVQALHDAESNLVYNEDNLGVIKLFIENCKAAKATVEKERVKLKEPSLQESRNIDAGAKLVTKDIDIVFAKADLNYQKLCYEVARKQQEAENERLRIAGIREQMNNFKNEFAAKIADCKTSQEIVAIERRFNLESANKSRYAEFLTEFQADCEAIRSHLRTQKEKVRELEDLDRKANLAAENGSDEQILEIMEKKEVLEAQIAEKRVNIQEEALFQSTKPTESATVILPIIPRGGRKLWRFEILDEKAAAKSGFMKLVPDTEKIDARLKEIRESETEVVENGIRYYIFKKW